MFYLISYDTPSSRRRRRMAKVIRDFADRVQMSVFEAYMIPSDLTKLRTELLKIIDAKTDDLRIYPVPVDTLKQVEILGKGELSREERAVTVVG